MSAILDYNFWLWQDIGLIFYACTMAVLFVGFPACIYVFLEDIIINYRTKNKNIKTIIKDFAILVFRMLRIFFAYYGIYVFFTGKTELTYLIKFLSCFNGFLWLTSILQNGIFCKIILANNPKYFVMQSLIIKLTGNMSMNF